MNTITAHRARITTMKELIDEKTIAEAYAAQGKSYHAQAATTALAGRVVAITSTGDAALDIYDLASALVDGGIAMPLACA